MHLAGVAWIAAVIAAINSFIGPCAFGVGKPHRDNPYETLGRFDFPYWAYTRSLLLHYELRGRRWIVRFC